MKTKLVKELSLAEQSGCIFCTRKEDDEFIFGKFYTNGKLTAHYNCLLFSSGLEQKGDDEDGILGFLTEDILKEVRRGLRLKCHKCRATGATVGCSDIQCKRTYHFPCGSESGMLNQYFGVFKSFCVNHRPIQKIPKRFLKGIQATCTICHEEVTAEPSDDRLWAPCCKKQSWFHRDCIQRLAISAGYFFKCPICSDDDLFIKEMKEMGINIPEQDASWELEPNAFQELLQRHNQCDHPTCICPKGRTHDDDADSGERWKLMLCSSCGSKGLHIGCGKLDPVKSDWECEDCCKTAGKSSAESPVNVSNTGSEAPSGSAGLKRPHPVKEEQIVTSEAPSGSAGLKRPLPGKEGQASTSEASSGSAGLKRPHPGKEGQSGGSSISDDEVEIIATVPVSSRSAQSQLHDAMPSCSSSTDCAEGTPRKVGTTKLRKVDKKSCLANILSTASTVFYKAGHNLAFQADKNPPVGDQSVTRLPNRSMTAAAQAAERNNVSEKRSPTVSTSFSGAKNGCQGMVGSSLKSGASSATSNEMDQSHSEAVDPQRERPNLAFSNGNKVEDHPPSIISHPMKLPQQLDEVGELSYREITIKIFIEKSSSPPRFFFEPVVILNPQSVIIQSQDLFQEDVVRFTIQMWNQEIRSKVLQLLRLDHPEVKEKDVRVMPYEEVQLVGKPGGFHPSVKIMEEAKSYHRLNEKLDFFLVCDSPSTGRVLAENMRLHPEFVLRKWQLAIECRGLAISSIKCPMERPLFKLFVSTFPAAGQDVCAAAKETVAKHLSLIDYDRQIKDLQLQMQTLADKTKDATATPDYEKEIKGLQSQIQALTKRKSTIAVPVFSVVKCTNPSASINEPLSFGSFEIETKKDYGDFDLETGIFTVKKTGTFQLNFNGLSVTESSRSQFELKVDGRRKSVSYVKVTSKNGFQPVVLSALLQLTVDQKVSINHVLGELYETTKTGYTRFSCLYFAGN